MSKLGLSESVTLQSAVETTMGTQPTTGWRQHQPNAGGIAAFLGKRKKVARSPLSKNRMQEKGDIVDLDAMPVITHDTNMDVTEAFAEGTFLSKSKHTGGTGVARWMVTIDGAGAVALTAVTGTAYTVASGGALTQNTLVYGRGFTNSANNGLHVVGASATGTSIIASGLVAEASPPATATLEVAGWRGAAGDIQMDGSGNITSTIADFTGMGLSAGMWIGVGGDSSNATLNFATAGYRGTARIKTVAAHLLTLENQSWTIGSADTGVGKTIDLYWCRWLRNVAIDNADYLDPNSGNATYSLEEAIPGIGAAGATSYVYANGQCVKAMKITAGAQTLAETQLSFVGKTVGDPTTVRGTGASAGTAPLMQAGFNTVDQFVRPPAVYDPNSSFAVVAQDIETWAWTLDNNTSGQKQQGTLGPKRFIPGKCIVGVDLTMFYVQPDFVTATSANNTLTFNVGLRNGDGAIIIDVPSFMPEVDDIKTAANGPITIHGKADGFRDSTYGYVSSMMIFPYLPTYP